MRGAECNFHEDAKVEDILTIGSKRTHGRDLWTLRETASEEKGSGEDEPPKARIPEVNIDFPIWKDMWHLICNFTRNYFRGKREWGN